MFTKKKNFENVTSIFIGLMVVILIAVSVVIPIVQEAIDTDNFTGTLVTLLHITPLLMVATIMLFVVSMYTLKMFLKF